MRLCWETLRLQGTFNGELLQSKKTQKKTMDKTGFVVIFHMFCLYFYLQRQEEGLCVTKHYISNIGRTSCSNFVV